MGRKAQWFEDTQVENVQPTPFRTCTIDLSEAIDPDVFAIALKDLCAEHNVKLNVIDKTIDV